MSDLPAAHMAVIDEPRAYLSCVAKGILVNWCQRKAQAQMLRDVYNVEARIEKCTRAVSHIIVDSIVAEVDVDHCEVNDLPRTLNGQSN
jgi:RNA polymerase sigma-70 factor (ECF subfamily)